MKRVFRRLIVLCVPVFCQVSLLSAQWEHIGGTGNLNVACFAAIGSNLFAGVNSAYDSGGVMMSTDNGATWRSASTGLPAVKIMSLRAAGTSLFAGPYDAGVYYSTNLGANWSGAKSVLTVAYVYDFAAIGSGVLAGTYLNGVYRSTNGGDDWAAADSGMGVHTINAFLVNGSDVYVATSGSGVYRSTNAGTTWSAVNTGLSGTYGYIDALGASATALYAGSYETGVFFSTNNGGNWIAASSGLPKNISIYNPILSIAVSGSKLFVANYGVGIYLSTNGGSGWSAVNGGLTHLGFRALMVSGTYLFAGGDSTGICRAPLSALTTAVDQPSGGVPSTFSLAQNYPNPLNPTTTIRYALPERSRVTLSVYNALGQLVTALVDGEEQAGSHEVKFDGTGIASGVYFYRLTAGSFVRTLKMSIVR